MVPYLLSREIDPMKTSDKHKDKHEDKDTVDSVGQSPRTELMLACLSNDTIVPGDSDDATVVMKWTGGALLMGR
jgi:hypothetical protein